MDLGHGIISRARDDRELRFVEAMADLLKMEARAERFARIRHVVSPPESGPAMSAKECAAASGWERGKRTGFSPRWFYEHWNELPFAVKGTGNARRFAGPGFRRWLAAQR